MQPTQKPPRIHLLPAKEAARCVVIARVRSKVWHVLDWNLTTGELVGGSWFWGHLYPLDSDLSWDGRYLVFFAAGKGRLPHKFPWQNYWTGVCEPPWLKTFAHISPRGQTVGGGVFVSSDTLAWYWPEELEPVGVKLPFRTQDLSLKLSGYLWGRASRMERDGWVYDGVIRMWTHRLSASHPELRANSGMGGYDQSEKKLAEAMEVSLYEFSLENRPDLITSETDWASWDANGDLIWAENGWLHRAHPLDLGRGGGPFQSIDLTGLEPPTKRL